MRPSSSLRERPASSSAFAIASAARSIGLRISLRPYAELPAPTIAERSLISKLAIASESREMLDVLIFVVAGTDAVFHDAEADVIAASPFDEMIAEGARLTEDRRIAEVPDLVLGVIFALVIAVIPAAITAVAAALQMPSRRMRDEGNLARLAVFEMQRDIAALERLHRSRRVPAKILLGFFQRPTRIGS